jgi:hypothetical protein
MSKKHVRKRKSARRRALLPQRPVILIVCEGSQTEPQYLNGFVAQCRNPRVKLRVVSHTGNPTSIVQEAIELRDGSWRDVDFDQVWCVFDVDDHEAMLPDARQLAESKHILLAASNPAFELWLLLHYSEPPGQISREQATQRLRKHVPEYKKHIDYVKHDCAAGYSDAVTRAIRLDKLASEAGTPGHNPTTAVYRLTESIRTG